MDRRPDGPGSSGSAGSADGAPTSFSISVPARAAIAGNPSDGFGGAVVAVPVAELSATVTATLHDEFVVEPVDADVRFADVGALVDHVDRVGYGDARRVVLAAVLAAVRLVDASPPPMRIEVGSAIPRSVGLAGSSAIVVGVIEAMIASSPTAVWARSLSSPDALAVCALAAEEDELGVTAGLQDRLLQAHRGPLLMDFSSASSRRALGRPCGRSTRLDWRIGPVVVAWRTASAEESGVVHSGLRDRRDDPEVVAAMSRLADEAHRAARAVAAGDRSTVGRAMDESFSIRRELIPLDPAHVEMIDVARSAGAHATYTGSGGAITVLAPDDGDSSRIVDALSEIDGVECTVTDPRRIGPRR